MQKLYDPIRKRLVAATPEERVRQGLLRSMLRDLGYPLGLLAVEKEIASGRRPDILCYNSQIRPLLIIECKAQKCDEEARKQAFGYNASLGAPFLCVADAFEVHTLWWDGASIVSVPFLPRFEELCKVSAS